LAVPASHVRLNRAPDHIFAHTTAVLERLGAGASMTRASLALATGSVTAQWLAFALPAQAAGGGPSSSYCHS